MYETIYEDSTNMGFHFRYHYSSSSEPTDHYQAILASRVLHFWCFSNAVVTVLVRDKDSEAEARRHGRTGLH